MTKIYLLTYPELKAFKVGKADNVFNRACNLKKWWGEPNYIDSFSLEIDASLAFKLEKGLHMLLAQFSMNYSEGDGKTEFFSKAAFSDAIEYINIFVKSNKLSSELAKGIDKPKVQKKKSARSKRDFYFYKHNASKKRTMSTYSESLKRMETVLRVNDLLIKYKEKIKFELVNRDQNYTLTLYDRKYLADVLFKNLNCTHSHFSGSFIGVNFSRSLKLREDCYELTFDFNDCYEDQLISAIAKEVEGSFRLLQKASKKLRCVA